MDKFSFTANFGQTLSPLPSTWIPTLPGGGGQKNQNSSKTKQDRNKQFSEMDFLFFFT